MKLQIPTEVPKPSNNTPIDLSNIFDVLLFIVAPLLLIVFYFILRKKSKQNKDSKKEDI
jgi:hypothetical protein